MLSKYLTPESIHLQVPAKNWQEAVQASGELLVKTRRCESRYIDAMIRAVYDMGPYMVIAPGIALTHARPEDGALQVGISIASLSSPVKFGSEANDPVELVISLCTTDRHSHIEMLEELAIFLMNEKNQTMLRSSKSVKEVIAAFQQPKQETIQCQN